MKNKNMAKSIGKALLWLYNNITYVIAGLAGILALILTVCNVFARYVLNSSYPGTEEYVMICFAYVVFLGAAAAYKAKMHYGIDVFINLCPEKIRKIVSVITQLLITVCMAYITYLAISYAFSSVRRTTSYARISYFWILLPMAVGFFLITLYSIENLVQLLRKGRTMKEGVDEA